MQGTLGLASHFRVSIESQKLGFALGIYRDEIPNLSWRVWEELKDK